MKQTFLAEFKRKDGSYDDYDFFRFGCKKLSTVIKYLRGYREQAKERHCEFLFKYLTTEADQFICTIYQSEHAHNNKEDIVHQCCASEL